MKTVLESAIISVDALGHQLRHRVETWMRNNQRGGGIAPAHDGFPAAPDNFFQSFAKPLEEQLRDLKARENMTVEDYMAMRNNNNNNNGSGPNISFGGPWDHPRVNMAKAEDTLRSIFGDRSIASMPPPDRIPNEDEGDGTLLGSLPVPSKDKFAEGYDGPHPDDDDGEEEEEEKEKDSTPKQEKEEE